MRTLITMTLLQRRDRERYQRRLDAYAEVREFLREVLHGLIPGHKIIVFGSLTKAGVFNDCSDVDLALETEPPQMDYWKLRSELMERMGVRVDVVDLNKCAFREKIRREGEVWIA